MSDSTSCDWVQIVEPRSREFMYANLITGECLWEAPSVPYKQSDDTEWWELFDTNTSRFYYYNAKQQKTVWHRPSSCDIIPLAKLQAIKRHSGTSNEDEESAAISRKEISTQTLAKANVNNNDTSNHQVELNTLKDTSQVTDVVESDNKAVQKKPAEKSEESENKSKHALKPSNKDKEHNDHHHHQNQRRHRSSGQIPPPPPPPAAAAHMPDWQQQKTNHSKQQQNHGLQQQQQPHFCWDPKDANRASFPQRSLGSPVSPLASDIPVDIPRSFGTLRSPECRFMANDFVSGYSRVPLESCRPPCFLRQESYPSTTKESFHGYAQEAGGIYANEMPVSAVQVTPMSRPKAFPRTNPSYVGTYKRNRQGQTSGNRMIKSEVEKCNEKFTHSMQSNFQTLNNRSIYANSDELLCTSGRPNSRLPTDAPPPLVPRHQQQQQYLQEPIYSNDPSMTTRMDPDQISPRQSHLYRSSHPPFDLHLPNHLLAKPLKLKDDRYENGDTTVTNRRKSEPEYVNVATRANRNDAIKRSMQGGYTDSSAMETRNGHSAAIHYSGRFSPPQRLHHPDMSDGLYVHSNRGFSARISDGLPEIDFDDSDRGSAQSTPSPQSRQFQTMMPIRSHSSSTYHPSLRKKKWLEKPTLHQVHQSTMEKSWSLQAELAHQRPLSMLTPHPSDSNVIANKVAGTLLQQMHIEQFVLENLNEHRKGILGKTVSVGHMLSWTKDPIQKPMIRSDNKIVKKEAPEIFRIIQMYMGDRKGKDPLMQMALEVAVKGWSIVELRDEVYIQLCRQTSKNPREESAVQGWELLGICLAFFPPSSKFYSYLDGHICKNMDACNHVDKSLIYIYTVSCQKRLEWIVHTGAKRGLRKPSLEEIEHAKKSLVEPSMFGSTLAEVMSLQKERYPERRLPWIQTALSEEVIRLNGAQTEGIFRVPGDIDEVNTLKVRCDRWYPPMNCPDPHVPASLLKLWYRELYEPLIPYSFYNQCLDNFANPEAAITIVTSLPEINRLVLTYLIRFLQEFSRPENATVTKMDVNNLAMVMAPNCLRCLSNDPRVIFENTRKEMGFLRTLVLNLDTSSIKDVL